MRTRGVVGAVCVALAAAAAYSIGLAQVAGDEEAERTARPVVRTTAAAAPAAPAVATLADFAWLEGTWRGGGPGGATAEIHYMAPAAGVMPSVFRLWNEDRVVVLEALTLVEEDRGLMLYVRHFTPALEPLEAERALTLRLTDRDGDRFVFENLYDENPRRSVLERTGPDAFLSRSELLRDDGTMDEIRVEYRRVDRRAGGPATRSSR